MANESPMGRGPGRYAALRNGNFLRYYVGQLFGTGAFWVIRVAVGWSAWEVSHSPFWTGVVAALTFMPTVLLSPLFGALADKVALKPAILAVCFAHMGVSVFLAVWIDTLALPGLCFWAAMLGLVSAANHPLRLQMVPRLVDRAIIPNTIGLTSLAFNMSRILGPALAGIVIDRYGAPEAYMLGALGYGVYFVQLLQVRIRPIVQDPNRGDGVLRMIASALRYALTLPLFLPSLVMTIMNGLVGRGLLELLPALAGEVLAGGATDLAVLTSSAGVGAVLSAVTVAHLHHGAERIRWMQLGSLAMGGAAVLALGVVTGLVAAAFFCALVGFSTSLTGISTQALLQISVDDRYRGRVMSFWTMLSFGAPVVGTVIIGAASEWIGLPMALVCAGLFGLGMTALLGMWRGGGKKEAKESR